MNIDESAKLLRTLRTAKGMTQRELAERLHVLPKTVSKWETGNGFPDVALIAPLAEALGVSAEALLGGKTEENAKEAGNMKRSKIYRCPACGNVIFQTGKAEAECCGQSLAPLRANDADEGHCAQFAETDGEYYVAFGHEMSKAHSIEFVACLTDDSAFVKKLYPEQDASCRVPIFRRGKYYCFCNLHGLFRIK